ncbi:IMP-specific 5'-nucleotidase-like protein 1 [Eremomyces bilateralis CBS 781.70]|uniref:IMP-specific 5'-nucleotidase 1 n=1 Tax=Eremomyces bilateralis CBS 781.70 TaxID=1392243 RepID=A0A6G1GB55_9PEZI|nr:IMP-specific 5'-nucleotidase-like protein 1 [Eremomyces bilateralis CBS 781.70]KAF1815141.1 IMP-specific 5'-nucleotidase-like protein 1 [Eremomyces bilateralis CBS 781.70]
MTTRYRVEYALKTHRRDQLIEWIKGLLAVPFVLHSQPTGVFETPRETVEHMATTVRRRYGEIMRDVEELINDHIKHQGAGKQDRSKLKLLVPSIGSFFTPLLLYDAFLYQDQKRMISYRRFVPPSFNDVRLILNTAQVLSLTRSGHTELITFDGDVTLYDDGQSLLADNDVVARLLFLLSKGTKIGIVTAAGYTEPRRYYERLHGLLDAIHLSNLPLVFKQNLIVLGGESNYLLKYDDGHLDRLMFVPRHTWILPEMRDWSLEDIKSLLDIAQIALQDCVTNMKLDAEIIRKERAVGIIPAHGVKFAREQLEETVLAVHKILEVSSVGQRVPFCAFNGGNDVFVDIGNKEWGVRSCQQFFGGIDGSKTLHVGDQFLSAGANDFKARMACTTAWIANPRETVQLLDEVRLLEELNEQKIK